MATNDHAETVRAWLGAVDERRFSDAQALLTDDWVDTGPDSETTRDDFVDTARAMLGDSDLRLTIHTQVVSNNHVATYLSWIGEAVRVDALRLDAVRDGKLCDSHFSITPASVG